MATAPASLSLSASTLPTRLRAAAVLAGMRWRQPQRGRMVVRAKIREIFMPALSSTMTEGKIVSWSAGEGDRVSKGDAVVVVESDKADMDVETFHDGIVAVVLVQAGESAPVGAPIALLAESEEEVPLALAKAQELSNGQPQQAPPAPTEDAAATPPPPSAPATAPTPVAVGTKGIASPHAKKLAKQHRVDLAKVTGTGPYGRITSADVEAAAGIQPKSKPAPAAAAPPPVAAPSVGAVPQSAVLPPVPGATVVPFTTMQAAVSKNMVESLAVPAFRVGYPIITDKLDELYEKVKPKGVTMTVLLAKAAAMALAQHPVVNASCRDGKSFTYNSNINIAVAVAIDGGLITPVLQDADKLDIYLLSQNWKDLVKKARAKQLQPNEYSSGTFTLSNLGMFGVDRFDAILPPGQGAIMAVGASKPTVVADKDGFFSVKSKMLVNVTADHRIVYGADLAAFLQTFAKVIEDPESLTL
ncbi:Dihydrolipoyllysine-residue acetyltransferase component 4 of pyruvate dehydrogenase complex, chloroplastic [Zea mays]|uniref:Dihydrolipoamide acetyltransferase component of pyruvate dehydrogenase complex n=2 Tax=Zea mays TaxID=4577 RepID=A0A1D6KPB2_MAIZE|nr:Dihydrolipoyllysine-residue acetyltransferase component 4 of pyruvate dehydrogenase complex, chloroplastic [Zea mays]ONM04644.1 Dihydrolipoyllysine-residue acetyltransferase component 4 of pyruvate dehydrogenase complex chloroplastic [Zea mays]ONM04645.1 Dihydrolipoyllysine-residue acetyltransferase component 4 of pyruvate dehydrogenase complex chloroplastic [Zea mays]